jgi:phosphotransferase system HPr (HPr) family protein
MRAKKVIVRTKNGLHMRVANRIIEKIKQSRSRIVFRKGRSDADARSILDLLMLAVAEGSEVEIIVDGGDEETVLRELEAVLIDGAEI